MEQRFLIFRGGKGDKDRRTVLPERLVEALLEQLRRLKVQHAADVQAGFAGVWLSNALESKYPNAPREWAWQWMFPTAGWVRRPGEPSEPRWRHHWPEEVVQRAMKEAVRKAGIAKLATPHTLRHFPSPVDYPTTHALRGARS